MTERSIRLPDAGRVQQFVSVLANLRGDFDLLDSNRILDARSLLGIFSFDLTKPIKLRIHHASDENLEAIKPFIAETESQG